jgi:hypothetical protein
MLGWIADSPLVFKLALTLAHTLCWWRRHTLEQEQVHEHD